MRLSGKRPIFFNSIVRMCAACNKLAEKFILKSNPIAVSANPAETCAAKKKVYGSGWE